MIGSYRDVAVKLGIASSVRLQICAPFPKSQEAELEHMIKKCKQELSPERYQDAFEGGKDSDLNVAIQAILRLNNPRPKARL